jgi:hypothetical protein
LSQLFLSNLSMAIRERGQLLLDVPQVCGRARVMKRVIRSIKNQPNGIANPSDNRLNPLVFLLIHRISPVAAFFLSVFVITSLLFGTPIYAAAAASVSGASRIPGPAARVVPRTVASI